MLSQVTNAEDCKLITDKYPEHFTFEADEWFSNKQNYSVKENDNIGFAEYKSPGIYWVHFCFNSARGRQAICLAKEMVLNLFDNRPTNLVIGLIENNNKKAKWVVRQVGFVSLGLVETKIGLCEMFYFIKEN